MKREARTIPVFISSLDRNEAKVTNFSVQMRCMTNVQRIKVQKVYLPKAVGLLDRGVVFMTLNPEVQTYFNSSSSGSNSLTFPLFVDDSDNTQFYAGESGITNYIELQFPREISKFNVKITDFAGNVLDFGEADNSLVTTEQVFISLSVTHYPQEF